VSDLREITDFYTIREAARLSGLAIKTWYQGGAGTANIPRIRFGRSIRLLRKDVEHFINERIVEAAQAAKADTNKR
jgi:hypothetical protein